MSFSIVVLCPNGRRETVKVTTNSSVLQILEEACRKQKLNPGNHELRHYNRTLDLSLPVRFSNLPNNAQVEMRPAEVSRTEHLVTVALQLESGQRVTKEFPPLTSLHDVIIQSFKSESIPMQEIGDLVCIYMRQKIAGDAIKTTTLRSLGLTSGKAIIRLLDRKPEDLEVQAHVCKPLVAPPKTEEFDNVQCNEEVECSSSKRSDIHRTVADPETISSKPIPIGDNIESNSAKTPAKTEEVSKMDVDEDAESFVNIERQERFTAGTGHMLIKDEVPDTHSNEKYKSNMVESNSQNNLIGEEPIEEIGDINYIGGNHAVIYSLDDITEHKRADLPEEFFELTVNDVKYLMAEYTKQRVELENQPLLTKEQREREILQKLAQYSRTVIRVYFPEKLVLQAVFMATETVQDVKDFLRNFLDDRDLNFYLYITPPKEKLNPSKSLIEVALVPAAVIHFGCDVRLPTYVMESLRSKLTDPRAAALAASKSRENNASSVQSTTSENVNNLVNEAKMDNLSSTSNSAQVIPRIPKQGKVPKWMKLSKQ